MAILSIEDLESIRKRHADNKIVFCAGSFDLVHAGHILFFEDCKKHGDILVVSIGSDSIIKVNKGDKRPILNEHIRLKTVDSLKPVDYCIIDNVSDKNNPNKILELVFQKLVPDYYIVNEDAFDINYRKELCNKYGVTLQILERWFPPEFEAISTSKIIDRIKSL